MSSLDEYTPKEQEQLKSIGFEWNGREEWTKEEKRTFRAIYKNDLIRGAGVGWTIYINYGLDECDGRDIEDWEYYRTIEDVLREFN